MKKILWSFTCASVLVSAAWSQVTVELEFEHRKLVQNEPVIAFVTVSNIGTEPFSVSPGGKGRSTVDIYIRRRNGDSVERFNEEPMVKKLKVLPREKRRIMVNVSRFYDLRRMGGHIARAEVNHQGAEYASRRIFFDVVGGLPLGRKRAPVPGMAGVFRTYQLSYLARGGQETLFLSITEDPSDRYFRAYSLGRLVRVHPPEIDIGRGGEVIIRHQSSPKRITRSILKSDKDGISFADQKYDRLKGRVGANGEWTDEE